MLLVNNKMIKSAIAKLAKMFITLLFLLNIQSCADLSSNPDSENPDDVNYKILISTPSSNEQLSQGNNEIIYSIKNPYSLKFVELYINGEFKRNYPPNADGSAPQIFYNFDSTYVGKTISVYLIYYDKDNTSSKSNVITNLNVTIDNRLPYKPYNVSLIKFDDGSCNISWKDSSHYIEKYQIWKKSGIEGVYSILQEVSGSTNNINDYGLDSSIIYFYKVKGIKNSGESPFSTEVNTGGIITSGNLFPPSDLTAEVTNSLTVKLAWKDNSDNENYFIVQRSIDKSVFSDITYLARNSTSYEDKSNLISGNTYYYRIKSYSNTDSAYSNIIAVKISSVILLPPSNLTATYNKDAGVVEIRWNKSDNNALYFDVERKINSSEFQLLRRVDLSTTIYLDFNITSGNNYVYRVRSYDSSRYSDYSNEVSVSTL